MNDSWTPSKCPQSDFQPHHLPGIYSDERLKTNIKTLDLIGMILIRIFKKIISLTTKIFTFISSSTSKVVNSLKDIREEKRVKKEEDSKLKSKIVSSKKPKDEIEEKSKSLNMAHQPDLPNTAETTIKEVELSEPVEISEEKTVMPSTELLDRALDDGSSLSEEEFQTPVSFVLSN